jgi:hypothetical protein
MLDTKLTTMDVANNLAGDKKVDFKTTHKYFDELRSDKRFKKLNEYTMNRLQTHPGESFNKPRWDIKEEFLNFYYQIC